MSSLVESPEDRFSHDEAPCQDVRKNDVNVVLALALTGHLAVEKYVSDK